MRSKVDDMHTDSSPVSRTEPTAHERLTEAVQWATDAERRMRVRCELRLYKPEQQQYVSLPSAQWVMDVQPDVTVGLEVKEAFELFIGRLIAEGPAKVRERLK